ncbi:MAG: hypothetical protein IPI60_18045 [Saprospiraceae bacterium]|nr:hypothetical protein [Saprospiraceae bacterium]
MGNRSHCSGYQLYLSWPDIYISAAGYDDPSERRNRLYVHQGLDQKGLPSFDEQVEAFGIADTGYTTQSVFLDHDRDGFWICTK